MNHYSDTTYNFLFFVINILSKIKRIKITFQYNKNQFYLNVFPYKPQFNGIIQYPPWIKINNVFVLQFPIIFVGC